MILEGSVLKKEDWQRSIGARSRNHCCRGKAIIITYSVCVCVCGLKYPECKAHAAYCIAICVLSGSIVCFHIIS